MIVRRPTADDRPAIQEALARCGAFSDEELRVAIEMFDAGLAGNYSLLGIESGGRLQAYACFGKAALTEGSWYVYWMCVHPDAQGHGLGRALAGAIADAARDAGAERLVLETSGRPDYERTRRFYERAGFTGCGRILGFYRPGDDCVIYCKVLAEAT